MADPAKEEIVLETEDDRTTAWDKVDGYIADDRRLFGPKSPHRFGVKRVHVPHPPYRTWGIYMVKHEVEYRVIIAVPEDTPESELLEALQALPFRAWIETEQEDDDG